MSRIGTAQLTITVPYDVDNDPHPRAWDWVFLTDTPGISVVSSRDSSRDPIVEIEDNDESS